MLGVVLAVAALAAAVWFGGEWATHREIWQAPWIVPSGVALEGEPRIGVAYRVTVQTHSGLKGVDFDGSRWGTADGLDDENPNPPALFGDPDHGAIRLTGADTAIYYSQWGAQRAFIRGAGLPPARDCL